MTRKELITTKNFIVTKMQLALLDLIGNFKTSNKMKDYELAKHLGVSKGYVSQLLKATFDHKMSKIADIAIACNKIALIHFIDIDEFVDTDSKDLEYKLVKKDRFKKTDSNLNTIKIFTDSKFIAYINTKGADVSNTISKKTFKGATYVAEYIVDNVTDNKTNKEAIA